MGDSGIEKRSDSVLSRISGACARVGRDPAEVTLIAVSKTFPEHAIREASKVGLRHFGENKAQEFAAKYDALRDELGPEVTWHFIGHLQRNKIKLVAGRADYLHGVDSLRLATALQDFAEREDLRLKCFIQVNVSGEDSKFGLPPEMLTEFVAQAKVLDRITFCGLMTLATPTSDSDRLRKEFRRLRKLRDETKNVIKTISYLSMGMTSDYEIAVEEGATHVRIGSALFGQRG